jgi:hypothetical protein
MKQGEPKPHSFCETPEEKCTMNYCYTNGCQNRKRELVEPKEQFKQENLEEVAEKLKSKELFNESNDRARKILSEIKSLPTQERMYSEEDMIRFANLYSDIDINESHLKYFNGLPKFIK